MQPSRLGARAHLPSVLRTQAHSLVAALPGGRTQQAPQALISDPSQRLHWVQSGATAPIPQLLRQTVGLLAACFVAPQAMEEYT